MNPSIDPANELTWTNIAPKSQADNTGGFLVDVEAGNYVGKLAVNVSLGVKTVGDSDAAIAIRVMSSTTNNISNATNFTPLAGAATVNTTNNAAASGRISVDPRAVPGRYLFYGVAITGTNSPAVPLAVSVVGSKKVQ